MSAHDLSDLPNLSLSKDPEISVEPPIRSAIIDGKSVVGINEEDEAFYRSFDKARRRRVRTKIDLRLLPVLSILYLFATLDRANIANAKIEGLKEDTGITDREYNIVLGVFFLPYFMLGT